MGLITLRPQATALTAPIDGGGTLIGTLCSGFGPLVDLGKALQAAGDGLVVSSGVGQDPNFQVAFADDGSIPAETVIASVQFTIRLQGNGVNLHFWATAGDCAKFFSNGGNTPVPLVLPATPDPIVFPQWTVLKTAALLVNPETGVPWTRADLFQIPNSVNGLWQIIIGNAGSLLQIDAISLLVQCTTPVSNLKLRMAPVLSIHNQPAAQVTATIRSAVPPRGGQRVSLGVRDPLLDGTIQSWTQVFEGATLDPPWPASEGSRWSWDCTAVGSVWLLNRRRPFGIWTNVSATQVIQDLIAQFAPSFSTGHVQTGLANITIAFDGSLPFDQCLTQIATLLGSATWEIDLQRDLHFFRVPPALQTFAPAPPSPITPLIVSESATPFTQSFLPAGYYGFFLRCQYADGTWSGGGSEVAPGGFSAMSNIVALSGAMQVQFTVPICSANAAGSPAVLREISGVNCNSQDGFLWPDNSSFPPTAATHLYFTPWVQIPDNTTTSYLHDLPAGSDESGSVPGQGLGLVDTFLPVPFRNVPGPATAPTVTETATLYATAAVAPFAAFAVMQIVGTSLAQGPIHGTPGFLIGGSVLDNTFVGYFDWQFGPGDYSFCVTNVYANGAESLPGPPTPPITLTGQYRIQFDNVPIGLPVEVPVAFRRIWICSFEPRPAHGVPNWLNPQLFLVVPDNTTTSLHNQQWANDPAYGNSPPATLHASRNNGVAFTHKLCGRFWPFFVPSPGVHVDGPYLETDPPPDPITFESRLDQNSLPTVAVDHSQIRNRVFLKGPGSVLAVQANIGDLFLHVVDITPFLVATGTLLVGASPALGVAITGCSIGNPTVVTTASVHGLATGQSVSISGNLPITGTFVVTVTDATHFTIPVAVVTATAGGMVTALAVGSRLMAYTGVYDPSLPYLTLSAPLTVLIPAGTAVNVWVQRDDVAAQVALSLVEDDGFGDGIREYRIPDGDYPTIATCLARCDAELALFANPIITVTYSTRDRKTRMGAVVHVDFVPGICDPLICDPAICDIADTSNPAAIVADLVIQDVVIDEIDIDGAHVLDPRMTVIASSVRYTFFDLLKQLTG
jgi:hypothetical protein